MGAEVLWKSMDQLEEFPPLLEECLDDCFFARDFSVRCGFAASECNQLIHNFKKPPDRRQNQYEWRYKIKAIKQFAQELSQILDGEFHVAFMPTSKRRGDDGYDDRFDQLAARLTQIVPAQQVVEPVRAARSRDAAHAGGRRTVDEIYQSFEYVEYEPLDNNCLVVVDDVVAAGTHFTAYKRMMRRHHPNLTINGVFWARAVNPHA